MARSLPDGDAMNAMLTLTTPDEMRTWAEERRRAGHTIGFVATMGALHDGHMALVADAARRCDDVVVSIFVNPLQFNETTDFDNYPRPITDDVDACRRVGVSAVYAPTAAAMYPVGFQTRVLPGALADVMEGPMRPGHFEGVVTVVAKLFGAVRPDVAIFGQKDYQQLVIITRMAADLDTGIDVVGHPIVREPDGLARSSRNRRLADDERAAAVCVPRSLSAAVAAAADPSASVGEVVGAATAVINAEPGAALEYVTVFDAGTLVEITDPGAVERSPGHVRVAAAVWFGDVRLIDNRDLFGD